jgi:cytochrome c biogenesis protein CcdA
VKAKILIPLFILLLASFAYAQEEKACIYYFHGIGCPHCSRVDPLIEKFEYRADVEIKSFEIYYDRSNIEVLNELFDAYNVPSNSRGIPIAFIGDTYLVGDTPIIENLEREIEKNKGEPCPGTEKDNKTGTAGPSSPTSQVHALSLFTIISAALVDSINPCAIAVLLILLGTLLAAGDRKKALKSGIAFTISIYIIYFLFGLGIFSALRISGLSYWFYKIVGFLAIIIGLANLKDYFWYGKVFVAEIPRSWRPTLKKLLKSVTSPLGAFVMGFAVCLFELPCTGGPYLFVLGLLAEKATQLVAIPILLLYNLFFVLPLMVITLMVYAGQTNIEKATEWKDKNIRLLHLIAGIVMLALGILVVSGIL